MKKIISMFLSVVLMLCVSSGFAMASEIKTSVVGTDNLTYGTIVLNGASVSNISSNNLDALEERYGVADIGNLTTLTGVLSLRYKIEESEQGQFFGTVEGAVAINGISHQFSAQGRLYRYLSPEGCDIYTGGLVGSFDGATIFDADKVISLSLTYNIATGQAFIPVAIGTFGDENSSPVMVEFGEYFSESSAAVDSMKAILNEGSTVSSPVSTNDIIIAPRINVDEYCLATGTGAYNGKTVIYHSYYGSKEALPSGNFLAKVKAQVHLSNFISAYNATLPPYNNSKPELVYTSMNHCVTDVWLNFQTNKTNNRIVDPLPAAFSSSLSLKWASFLLPKAPGINYLMSYLSLSIPLNGVSHTYNSSYSSLQTKMWKNDLSEAVTNSTSPYNTDSGVANNFLVFNSMNAGTTCTATTSAKAQIFFEDVTVGSNAISRWVVVTSSSSTATLKSVN